MQWAEGARVRGASRLRRGVREHVTGAGPWEVRFREGGDRAGVEQRARACVCELGGRADAASVEVDPWSVPNTSSRLCWGSARSP